MCSFFLERMSLTTAHTNIVTDSNTIKQEKKKDCLKLSSAGTKKLLETVQYIAIF